MISDVFVSAVAALHDDAAIAVPFLRELAAVLRRTYENHEVILVDDGSRDGTAAALAPLLREIPGVRLLRLSRRFGVEVALTAGLESAIGDVVVTLDPETDPVELIPDLVERARAGGGVACGRSTGWRRRSLGQRLGSRLFHGASRRFLGLELQRDLTLFRAFSRQAVNALVQMRDKTRQFRALAPYIGFATETVDYQARPRRGRARRVGFLDDANAAVSLVVATSTRPLRIVSFLGLLASLLNLLYIGYIVAVTVLKDRVAEGWVTLSLQHAVMFLFLFVILTVVTEYLGRVFLESRDRPLYYVAEEMSSQVVVAGEDRRNVLGESR